MSSTILEALHLLNESEPSYYKKDPDVFLAHFTDNLSGLISIYNQGQLQPKYQHDFISFEDEIGRISKRYAVKNLTKKVDRGSNKYKFGIAFDTEYVKGELQNQGLQPLIPYADVYEKMQQGVGVRVHGVYQAENDSEKAFFLECVSEDFRTLALIHSEALFTKIVKRMEDMNQFHIEDEFIQDIPGVVQNEVQSYNTVNGTNWKLIPTKGWHYNLQKGGYTTLSIGGSAQAKADSAVWENYVQTKSKPEFKQWLETRNELEKIWPDFIDALIQACNYVTQKDWGRRRTLIRFEFKNYYEDYFDLAEYTSEQHWDSALKARWTNATFWEAWDRHLKKCQDVREMPSQVVRNAAAKFNSIWMSCLKLIRKYCTLSGVLFGRKSSFAGRIRTPEEFEQYENSLLTYQTSGNKKHIIPLYIDNADTAEAEDVSSMDALNDSDFNEKEWRIAHLPENQVFHFNKENILFICFPVQYKIYWDEFKQGITNRHFPTQHRQDSYNNLMHLFGSMENCGQAPEWISNLYYKGISYNDEEGELFDYTDPKANKKEGD